MKNEKLMRAMGEIDEDLIAEAHEARKPRTVWVRWAALAAGLILLLVCVPVLMTVLNVGMSFDMAGAEAEKAEDFDPHYSLSGNGAAADEWEDNVGSIKDLLESLQGGMNSPAEEKPETELGVSTERRYYVGDTVRFDDLAITYLAADRATVDLHVKKNENKPLVLSVDVVSSDGKGKVWTASTDGEGREYFSFTVNGEKTDSLPQEAGVYDITVDLSAFSQSGKWRITERIAIVTFDDYLILVWE